MYPKQKVLSLCLGGFLVLALVSALIYSQKTQTVPDLFEQKLNVRLELRAGEEGRIVTYYPDGITAEHAIADHKDGLQSQYWYRPDGTLKEAVTFDKELEGPRSVLRRAKIDSDGQTFLNDEEYYPDGSPKRTLKLTEPDVSVEETFFEGSVHQVHQKTTISRANENGLWALVEQFGYRLNGTMASHILVEDTVKTERLFDENEVLAVLKVHNPAKYSYTETEYRSDDGAVKKTVEQNSSSTTIAFKRPDGSTAEEWVWYGPVGKTGLHINYFDEKGAQTYHQWWSLIKEELRLNSVSVYDKSKHSVNRVFYLNVNDENGEAGGVQIEVLFHSDQGNNGPHALRNYRSDGSLSLHTEYSKGSTVLTKVEHSEEEKRGMEKVNKAWFSMRELAEMPPQVIEYVADDE